VNELADRGVEAPAIVVDGEATRAKSQPLGGTVVGLAWGAEMVPPWNSAEPDPLFTSVGSLSRLHANPDEPEGT
jgi:hypothetical protein